MNLDLDRCVGGVFTVESDRSSLVFWNIEVRLKDEGLSFVVFYKRQWSERAIFDAWKKMSSGRKKDDVLNIALARSALETSLMINKSMFPSLNLAWLHSGPGEVITFVTLPA